MRNVESRCSEQQPWGGSRESETATKPAQLSLLQRGLKPCIRTPRCMWPAARETGTLSEEAQPCFSLAAVIEDGALLLAIGCMSCLSS